LAAKVDRITWMDPAMRADWADRITQFVCGQIHRIQSLLSLGNPKNEVTHLCGSDAEIAVARSIIDTSVGVLLLPANIQDTHPSDAIVYRRHVAASTMRYAEQHARQAVQKFTEDAQRVAHPFQVTAGQITWMMERQDVDAHVKAIDPHGSLRRRWQDVRASRLLVSECQAAAECLDRFASDHQLNAMESAVA
jgi:hypothetical protein